MNIPRVLVFDKVDGHLVLDTGTIINGLRIKTDQEIYDTFGLSPMDIDNFRFYRCSWGEFYTEFNNGGIPTFNTETDEITWEYTKEQQEKIDKFKELENKIDALGKVIVQDKLKGGNA